MVTAPRGAPARTQRTAGYGKRPAPSLPPSLPQVIRRRHGDKSSCVGRHRGHPHRRRQRATCCTGKVQGRSGVGSATSSEQGCTSTTVPAPTGAFLQGWKKVELPLVLASRCGADQSRCLSCRADGAICPRWLASKKTPYTRPYMESKNAKGSARHRANPLISLVGPRGVEPRTNGL